MIESSHRWSNDFEEQLCPAFQTISNVRKQALQRKYNWESDVNVKDIIQGSFSACLQCRSSAAVVVYKWVYLGLKSFCQAAHSVKDKHSILKLVKSKTIQVIHKLSINYLIVFARPVHHHCSLNCLESKRLYLLMYFPSCFKLLPLCTART